MERLPQPFIGNAKGGAFGNRAGGHGRFLYFGRADPIARRLDHLVRAARKGDEPICIPNGIVARPDRRPAITRRGRRGAKPKRGAFRIPPLSLAAPRPPVHHSARLAVLGTPPVPTPHPP